MRHPATQAATRGSVLVPVVGAMLVLMLCGIALAETFAAARTRSALGSGADRAHWIAEAGAWHAAESGTEIATPVGFGGGSYTVAKTGEVLVATGVLGEASATVRFDLAPFGGSGGGAGGAGPFDPNEPPLDIEAGVASVRIEGSNELVIDLVSATGHLLVLNGFSIQGDFPDHPPLKEVRMDDKKVVSTHAGGLPIGHWNIGSAIWHERVIGPGDSIPLKLKFDDKPAGVYKYSLGLYFADGRSETLDFIAGW